MSEKSEHRYKYYCHKCNYKTDLEGGAQSHSELKCHPVSSRKPQVEQPQAKRSKWLQSKDGD